MAIHVVGGVYYEQCLKPAWNNLYGSAGRVAVALANIGAKVHLHSYFTDMALKQFRNDFGLLSNLTICPSSSRESVYFRYVHDSAKPEINPCPVKPNDPLIIKQSKVVRFGMMEGDAVIQSDWAVYDPQNSGSATRFGANGSTAQHLALILNYWEAQVMSCTVGAPAEECGRKLVASEQAEVVIIKMGARGALVFFDNKVEKIPAYKTSRVWKIGSGDCFVGYFAYAWMERGLSPVDSAIYASKATSFYCERMALPFDIDLEKHAADTVDVSPEFATESRRRVYLAGPFFNMPQIWLVDQARRNLTEFGLEVFSPFHDIGLGCAQDVVGQDLEGIKNSHVLFAILDGLDSGTLFEVGYARAIGIPVVAYSEKEDTESLKMLEGSDCMICRDYTTALYTTLWESAKL